MNKLSHYLSIAVLALFSVAANAATVWAPTDLDAGSVVFNFNGVSTNGGVLAMFDADDFAGTALMIGGSGGVVSFVANGSDWDAIFSGGGSITLSGDQNFTLGMTWNRGATWYADSSFLNLAPASVDTYEISFLGPQPTGYDFPLLGKTIAAGLKPVPVPAAAWLFATGLIGLAGVARRRA